VRSDPAQALHEAELSLRVDRTDTASLAVKAAALSRLGREAEAGQVLQLSLRHEPRNFVTMLLLGDHETRSGRPAAARVWYRRALALNPQDPTLRALAGRPS
jgi:Flp pilus assembly protein TadD